MLNLDALLDGDAQIATPEFALVVAATRWPHDPRWAARIRDLASQVTDWPRVAAIVERHRVAGLFAAGLNHAGLPDIDAGTDARAAIGRSRGTVRCRSCNPSLRRYTWYACWRGPAFRSGC
ncbi:hypothetical protein QP185_07750 [Sphingomonas aerolata]|uniref:hypothetical protein n=1 Tax=Sphingomonas aerolata TaxID=185951 RepID=UPI002FE232B0